MFPVRVFWQRAQNSIRVGIIANKREPGLETFSVFSIDYRSA